VPVAARQLHLEAGDGLEDADLDPRHALAEQLPRVEPHVDGVGARRPASATPRSAASAAGLSVTAACSQRLGEGDGGDPPVRLLGEAELGEPRKSVSLIHTVSWAKGSCTWKLRPVGDITTWSSSA